jgi:hypothetical protein
MQAIGTSGRRTRRRRGYLALAATLMLVLCAAAPPTVEADDALNWSAPVQIDPENGFRAISCPATTLCVAVDDFGDVATSTSPTGGAAAWTLADVDTRFASGSSLEDVSCPTTTFCAAVDDAGDVVTSTNPTGGASAWHLTILEGLNDARAIACASAQLCVAINQAGEAAVSTSPTGGASTWTIFPISGAGPFSLPTAIACPSTTLCAAVDIHGNVLTSTNPTGGTAAWTATEVDPSGGLTAISCPSTTFCAVVDETAKHALISSEPAGGASAWSITTGLPGFLVNSLSCASASFCAASEPEGVLTSTDPTGNFEAWRLTPLADERRLTGIACPTAKLCVLVDKAGNVLTGQPAEPEPSNPPPPAAGGSTPSPPAGPPPTIGPVTAPHVSTAQLIAHLRQQLTPYGPAASLRSLLKHGGLTVPFKMPEAGTVSVNWYLPPRGAKLARRAKPVLVASGKLTLAAGSTGQLRIKLTAVGKRQLQHAKRVKLTARAAFTPSGGVAVSASAGFTLKASAYTAARASAIAPGIYLSGPQAISLNTAYVYRVTVLTNRSYKGAALWFSTVDCAQRRVINLVAHRPWRGSFTVAVSGTAFRLQPSIAATIISPPTKRPPYAHTLLFRALPLSESATAVPPSPPGPPEHCQHFVGS